MGLRYGRMDHISFNFSSAIDQSTDQYFKTFTSINIL